MSKFLHESICLSTYGRLSELDLGLNEVVGMHWLAVLKEGTASVRV